MKGDKEICNSLLMCHNSFVDSANTMLFEGNSRRLRALYREKMTHKFGSIPLPRLKSESISLAILDLKYAADIYGLVAFKEILSIDNEI